MSEVTASPSAVSAAPSDAPYWCHFCQARTRPVWDPDLACATCHQGFLEVSTAENNAAPHSPFHAVSAQNGGAPTVISLQNFIGGFLSLSGIGEPGIAEEAEQGRPYGSVSGLEARQNHEVHNEQVPIHNLRDFLSNAFGGPPMESARSAAQSNHDSVPLAASEPNERERNVPYNHVVRFFSSMLGGTVGQQDGGMGIFIAEVSESPMQAGPQAFQHIIAQLMEQVQGPSGPQPAPPEVIRSLTSYKLTKEMLSTSETAECAICKEDLMVDDAITLLPCKHSLHSECLRPWLEHSGTCPLCRSPLSEQPRPGQARSTNAYTNASDDAPPGPLRLAGMSDEVGEANGLDLD